MYLPMVYFVSFRSTYCWRILSLKKVEDESVGVFFLQLESFFNGIVFLFSSFSGVGIPLQNMPCPTPLYYLKIIPPAKSYSYGGKI